MPDFVKGLAPLSFFSGSETPKKNTKTPGPWRGGMPITIFPPIFLPISSFQKNKGPPHLPSSSGSPSQAFPDAVPVTSGWKCQDLTMDFFPGGFRKIYIYISFLRAQTLLKPKL